jgi:hypothetical protein
MRIVSNLICKLFCNSLIYDAWNFYIHTVFEPSTKKTSSLLFMLRKEEYLWFGKISTLGKEHPSFVNNRSLLPHQSWWSCNSQLTLCLSIFFHFCKAFSEDRVIGVIWCMMWCYARWCDDMMQRMMLMPKTHTHAETHNLCVPLETIKISLPLIFQLHRLFFGVSSAPP